ncbi:MAG: Golgi transport complex subunit 3 [Sclerophora amabilis]|nr:MAG: Golgi transport complex subunit 3 [Sclerophora amabilis]
MYEDAWYNAFVPSSRQQENRAQAPKHRRRESLLKQPEEGRAYPSQAEGRPDIPEEPELFQSPPKATLARRAKSYSDFYDVARAHLRKNVEDEVQGGKPDPRRLKTELGYRRWFDGIQAELWSAHHQQYSSYRDELKLSQFHLDSLLESNSSALDILSSLTESFRAVEAQTTAFRAKCQGLLTEQDRMTKLTDDIGENLQYYNYLEPITRRLNAPGAGRFVRGKEFSGMLSKLDVCLEYMQNNARHRESQTYRSRYRLLLTRALTLVRVHFVSSLREIAIDVSKRIADRQLNDTTMSALLYAKFRVGANELKQVGQEVRKRAIPQAGSEAGAEAEYQSLMNELYESYSTTRGKLVIPLARKKMGEIAIAPSSSKDLVKFARSSIGYIRSTCFDEHELWREWFEGDEGLYDFLESVCEPLYDYLRPRIIHENQLIKLCELCTFLQTRYMHDQEDETEVVDVNQLDFSVLIQPALEDAQTRLVFRTQAILRAEIENYRPVPKDLDYPARNGRVSLSGTLNNAQVLSGRKESNPTPMTPVPKIPTVVDEDAESGDERETNWNLDRDAIFEGWYPTLRKAIWLLSRIYKLVNSTVFDDLAHQIVHQTTLSLHRAAVQIGSQVNPVDGQLFLIKHLLILKSQIVAFDIEFVTPEVSFDFSSVTNTFWELRERGGLVNPKNLIRLMGGGLLPRVVENMLDAKAELDGRLRTGINNFVNGFADRMTQSVGQEATKKRSFNGGAAVKKVREATEKETPMLRRKLDEYLDDARTKEALVGAVEEQVLHNYEEFWGKYMAKTKPNGQAISHKGKGREDAVWDLNTFTDWTEGVFKVGNAGRPEADSDSYSRSVSNAGSN